MLLLSNSALLLSKGGLLLCYGYQTFNEIVMLVKLVKVKVGFRIVKKCHYYNKYIYLFNSEPKWRFPFSSLTLTTLTTLTTICLFVFLYFPDLG